MGYFFERVGRAFSFIGSAVAMAFRDKDLFIPSLLSLVANGAYVAIIILLLGATNTLWLIGFEESDVEALKTTGRVLTEGPAAVVEDQTAAIQAKIEEDNRTYREAIERGEDPGEVIKKRAAATAAENKTRTAEREAAREKAHSRRYVQWAFGVVTLFGAILITYVFSAMTVSLVYDHLCGKDARIGEAFSVVMARLPGIVLLAIISTIVSVLAQAARGKKGGKNVVGAIIGGLIEQLWTVASFLILPAMVIHKLSLWQGLKRAKEIAVGNLLIVAVGEIAVGLVGSLIAFFGVAGGVLVGFFTYRVIPHPFYIPVGVGGLIAVLAIAFAIYVRMAYYTCLYVNAVESAQTKHRVPAKGPLAAALS